MPTTPKFSLRYPAGGSPNDAVTDLQNLATDVDNALYPRVPTLARQTLGGTAASVTFSSIPTTLRSVRIRWTSRCDNAVQTQFMFLRINGDSGNNYSTEYQQAVNATITASNTVTISGGPVGYTVGASAPATGFASGVIDLVGWDSPHPTNLGWTFISQALGTGAGNFSSHTGGGIYFPAGPYTQITLFPNAGNFIAGSDFQLEGMPT